MTFLFLIYGDRGRGLGTKAGGRSMEEGLEMGGKWDFQGGRQWENIAQYFAIKKAQRGGSQQKLGRNWD